MHTDLLAFPHLKYQKSQNAAVNTCPGHQVIGFGPKNRNNQSQKIEEKWKKNRMFTQKSRNKYAVLGLSYVIRKDLL